MMEYKNIDEFFKEAKNIGKQILEKYNPIDVILFGSVAKGCVRKNSDIDICVIINTENKRKLVQDMILNLDYKTDLDIVIYTLEEWERYKKDPSTFAYSISKNGVSLIG